MFGRGVFRLGLGVSAAAVASVLGMNAAVASADTALVLGGTGLPTPGQTYVNNVENLYLGPLGFGSYNPQVVTTPEQAYPLTGANSLPVTSSLPQGAANVTDAVNQQIAQGNKVVVFGYSQGSSVATLSASQLASQPNPPSPDQLSFVMVGDPESPNGGLSTRFALPGTSLPLLGEIFTASPNNPYPTTVYNQEYDGFVDFPQYPLNFVSDLNAIVGIFTQHFGYAALTSQQLSSAVQLPTTGGNTTYYMVQTPDLPLLDPVRLIPLVGNPIADLIQPDLKVIVNLGYGNIANGWSPGPANVQTPIGLIPTNINLSDLGTALLNGIPQGITNALNDLKTPSLGIDFSSLSLLLSGLNSVGLTSSPTPSLTDLLGAFATIGNAGVPVTSTTPTVLANDLAIGKPLLDTVSALVTTIPQYDAQIFTSQLASGNLLNAVGLPIAADLALVPYTLLIGGVFPIVDTATTTITQLGELTGLIPNPPADPAPATPKTSSTVNTTVSTPVNTSAVVNTPTTPNPSTTTVGSLPKGLGLGSAIKTALTPKTPVSQPKVTPTAPLNLTPTSPPSTPKPTGTPAPVTPHPVSAVTGAGAGKNGPSGTGTDTGNARNTTGSTGLHRTHG